MMQILSLSLWVMFAITVLLGVAALSFVVYRRVTSSAKRAELRGHIKESHKHTIDGVLSAVARLRLNEDNAVLAHSDVTKHLNASVMRIEDYIHAGHAIKSWYVVDKFGVAKRHRKKIASEITAIEYELEQAKKAISILEAGPEVRFYDETAKVLKPIFRSLDTRFRTITDQINDL